MGLFSIAYISINCDFINYRFSFKKRFFTNKQKISFVCVEVETLDQTLSKDEVFGTVEAVKTVSDLFLPLAGEIISFNDSLESDPEKVNSDPYGEGWMVKVKVANVSDFNELLTSEAYATLIGA